MNYQWTIIETELENQHFIAKSPYGYLLFNNSLKALINYCYGNYIKTGAKPHYYEFQKHIENGTILFRYKPRMKPENFIKQYPEYII